MQCDEGDSSTTSSSSTSRPERRKLNEKGGKSSRKGKRGREDTESDWLERFENLWERRVEQERESRESTHQIMIESLRSQMEQANAVMAAFKDIFQKLLK